ncbi:hypothetical protein A8C56_19145 [Niabella ginsenosidivorans]|uniref:Uncharacterized protein n=1 Tax=Niabella ginsenosidivorans TaxID=1176587 RepID=A0A1A9I553_9BACT|nr:hypothetical protein [Niabella ginsenosidivorans]ANH82817.1 hypothetical protein A8C56_19145 [Niabella ginsenosidivorans]
MKNKTMDTFEQMSDDEKLRAENDFLKMKLMLEHGAHFGDISDNPDDLSPEMENQLLNNVMALEEQFAKEHKTIKVFDKIDRPQHFKPVAAIPGKDIKHAWEELSNYLNKYGIDLAVCSPNISTRELYRFTIEELFEYEMDDINLPGWTTNFIYDEFYPDPVYDNSRLVQQDLLGDLFSTNDLFCEMQYTEEGFYFNGTWYNTFKNYSEKINRFKSLFDEIELEECTVNSCTVNENDCCVTGNYKAVAQSANSKTTFSGNFTVGLIKDDAGYWNMKDIEIEGFNLAS